MSLPKELTDAVYKRDGWKCRHCKSRNGLHPHHVIFKSQLGPDAPNNLLSVCWECHRAIHDGDLRVEVITVLENDLLVRFVRINRWMPKG